MAQTQLAVTDANGTIRQLAQTSTAGGQLANAVIGDANGNLAVMAPGGEGALLASSDGTKATYRFCLLAYAMVASPTDVIMIGGSATKTVRVKRIKITGQATAQGAMPVILLRRSTASTGTPTSVNPGKHDTTDPAATGTVVSFGTSNPTVGVGAGFLCVDRLGMSALSTGTAGLGQAVVWDFATREDKAIILRGTSDFLCINFNGATIPSGGVVDFEVETEEDNS